MTTTAESPPSLPARNSDFDAQKLESGSALAQCEYPQYWSHEMTNSLTAHRVAHNHRAAHERIARHTSESPSKTSSASSSAGAPRPSQQTVSLFLTISGYFAAQGYQTPESLAILESKAPNAFARRGREVVLTTTLLDRVTERSELAFILAHEFAHVALRHGPHGGISAEVAADTLALQVVTALGFNPCSGPSVLERLGTPSQLTLVSVTPRLHALHDQTSSVCG